MKRAQIRVARRSPAYWRVIIDNPPINVMGQEMVPQLLETIDALEGDEHIGVVVSDSAVDDYFLNHSDFLARLEDLKAPPSGPTGLAPWPDFLVRLTRGPMTPIALIRGQATGKGAGTALACDKSFASCEKAILSQREVGVGMVAGGGPMALPQLIGHIRAFEVLWSSEDIARRFRRGVRDPDRRIRQVGDRKHQAPREHQPAAGRRARRGWDACIDSLWRSAAQWGSKRRWRAGSTIRGCRESDRIPRPNRAQGGSPTRFSTLERWGWEAFEANLGEHVSKVCGDVL